MGSQNFKGDFWGILFFMKTQNRLKDPLPDRIGRLGYHRWTQHQILHNFGLRQKIEGVRTQNQSCAEFDEDSESASGLAQLTFVVELEPFEGPVFTCKPMGAPNL